VVEQVDPFSGSDLDVVDPSPRPTFLDQLGLVESLMISAQRVVERGADGAERGLDAGSGEPFAVGQRHVLRPVA
jgi:hypothetical protein